MPSAVGAALHRAELVQEQQAGVEREPQREVGEDRGDRQAGEQQPHAHRDVPRHHQPQHQGAGDRGGHHQAPRGGDEDGGPGGHRT